MSTTISGDEIGNTTKRVRQKKSELPDVIPEGTRNNTLFSHGVFLKASGMPNEEIGRVLSEANKTRCQPPMAQGEVDRIVRNACSFKSGKPIGNGTIIPIVRLLKSCHLPNRLHSSWRRCLREMSSLH